VNSQQRDAVYGLRKRVIGGDETRKLVMDIVHDALLLLVETNFPPKAPPEDLKVEEYNKAVDRLLPVPGLELTMDEVHHVPHEDIVTGLMAKVDAWYASKEQLIGEENTRYRERYFILTIIDGLWKKHLQAMSHLRSGIGLRGYGQRNPLLEYKKEGFNMFNMMLDLRDQRVIEQLFGNLANERELTEEEKVQLLEEQRRKEEERAARAVEEANRLGHGKPSDANTARQAAQSRARQGRPVTVRPVKTIRREGEKLGRNDPCWCGSGKKYKKCHRSTDLAEGGGDEAAAPPPA